MVTTRKQSSRKIQHQRTKTHKLKKSIKSGTNDLLRNVFGEMILQKDTILYHTSKEPYRFTPSKPMLFTTFHPSEWAQNHNLHITTIKLKKNISLFFMIGAINNLRIFPLLDTLINTPRNNLAKQSDVKLKCFVNYLLVDKFQGWFSTIEGKTAVEVALINNQDNFEVVSTNKLVWDWKNSNYTFDFQFLPKNWGSSYPISSLIHPIMLNINIRYKDMIERYVQQAKRDDPDGNVFQILLNNAKINYINAPVVKINWKC